MSTMRDIDDNDTTATGDHRCSRCAATGQFITMVMNGKPGGPGGDCYRCGGKGYHTDDDRRRNWGYDMGGYAYRGHGPSEGGDRK